MVDTDMPPPLPNQEQTGPQVTQLNNVTRDLEDENLPMLLDNRGGTHVSNVPKFNKDDFASWKFRFLTFLDGIEPYLITTLEEGPFIPMSTLSTSANPLPKPKK